ncbi:MAG TPA: lyase family protein [Ensifer sp.]|jgi:aspartate ammonia-lyase|uniref:lyase family protein n=1 Tax=Ensifer sp. TaxID=1872086 RepID=UPI002E151C9B|nr:lyase family protein [Ensifer sp.]
MIQGHLPTRQEVDSIGAHAVPALALYGIQTQRAVELYPLGGAARFSDYPQLLDAMLRVKKSAARTNIETGAIETALGEAIIRAIEGLLAEPRPEAFPVHACHGGGGISFNMNINEVVANLANAESFGSAFGSYAPIHPNDHVNLNHSTADCLSTGCHIAAHSAFESFSEEIEGLAVDLDRLGAEWAPLRKLARTCLQDAVDIGFEDYLGGVAACLRFNLARASQDAEGLRRISLGGNIIGRSTDCDPAFFARIIPVLNEQLADAGLSAGLARADNLFAASQAHDRLLALTGSLEQTARTLIRFAKDLRLMASGPHGGLGEIHLPAVQPGSSAIPGKVNPTIPEFMVQCAMMACGRAAAVVMTADHGEMDYNPWEAVVVTGILDMVAVLKAGVSTLRRNCIEGMRPDVARNTDNATSLLPSLIRLKQLKGYSHASAVAKEAAGDLAFVRRRVAEAEAG